MNIDEKQRIRFRIFIVIAFFALGLGSVLARAYQLQIMESDKLASIAKEDYIWTVKLPPERGTIFDRERNELAISVQVKSVYAHPDKVRQKGNTARLLSDILGLNKVEIQKILSKNSPFVWVQRKIDPDKAERVEQLKRDGIGIVSETRRYYPGKQIAAQLIGFSGIDHQGLEGLEFGYDKLLIGPEKKLVQMRDAMSRPFSTTGLSPSSSGPHHLILTIDKDIQYKAEQVLQTAVEQSGAKAGHCVVVDPGTGEILAMAVAPVFNPNAFSKYNPSYWRNRCITDCYEPGSTFKAFLLAASLEEGAVTPSTKFDCEKGEFMIGGHVIHDTHKHGILPVSDIITLSSNIGAIKIGMKLGYQRFHKYLLRFGFGKETGVGLPGEREGFLRPIDKTEIIDQANLFFGQGMTTTSLQMAMAISAIANGGNLMRPIIVSSVFDESGRVVLRNRPSIVRRVLSEETAKEVAEILEGVLLEDGTGRKAFISGFRAAGKTGTAQKVDPNTKGYSREKHVAGFMGFVPIDIPRLVIVVMIDEPKGNPYGGIIAAPVFREVGKWSLNKLGINPQIRLVERPLNIQVKSETSKAGSPKINQIQVREKELPDFTGLGMREVLRRGKTLGLNVIVEGTGFVYAQEPAAGSPLYDVSTLRVNFKPPS